MDACGKETSPERIDYDERKRKETSQSESIVMARASEEGPADTTLGRGGSAAHMVDMTRRSDLPEGRADTLGRGGSAAHMVNMARCSDLAEGRADAIGPRRQRSAT